MIAESRLLALLGEEWNLTSRLATAWNLKSNPARHIVHQPLSEGFARLRLCLPCMLGHYDERLLCVDTLRPFLFGKMHDFG